MPTTSVAVAFGAKIIERHITLDRAMWGTDHAASLGPVGLRSLVGHIRSVEKALGDGVKKVYNSEIPVKEKIKENNLNKLEAGPVHCIVTPFKEDMSIDFASLENYLQYSMDAGANKFYVMAYNSRFSELSWDEIKILNKFVTKFVKEEDSSNFVIVADPLHCSTAISLEFTQEAEDYGADMISLIFREKFYKNEQILEHFKYIDKESTLPILIHEMPLTAGHGGLVVNWPIELLDNLADIESVKAIKEDAKNDDYSLEVINTLKDRLSIVISGGEKAMDAI